MGDVLDQVAEGMKWSEISRQWDGAVTSEAISESVLLAKSALFKNGRALRKSA